MSGGRTTVIKVGGSILKDEASYDVIARLLSHQVRREPTWIVISAARGVTDTLEQLANPANPDEITSVLTLHDRLAGVTLGTDLAAELQGGLDSAREGHRDRLLAWGERASVRAVWTRLCHYRTILPVVELQDATPLPRLPSALVPGFYVRDTDGKERCLPRGGGDISAVLLARSLGAGSVRLWKDGGGIHSNGGVVSTADARTILRQTNRFARPLHSYAVRLATDWGIDLILEDPLGEWPSTCIVAPRTLALPPQPIANRAGDATNEPTWELGERSVTPGMT